MKFVRSLLFALIMATVTACQPKSPTFLPTKVESAPAIKNKTVALIRDDIFGDTHAYCSGVWVSESSFVTAHHCMSDAPIGTRISYVVESDVFDPTEDIFEQYKPHKKIQPRLGVISALDPRHDLALVHTVLPVRHEVAKLARQKILPGMFAQQVGQSLGLWWSYSSGDISAVRWGDAGDGSMLWVQTTVPTSPGNSGGGIFNARGELLGICHGTHLRGQNINIFIHPIYVETFLDKQGKNL